MNREDYRQQTTASRKRDESSKWLWLLASIPFMPLVLLQELLAAPFVARRHEGVFRWMLFMAAQLLGAVIFGACVGLALGYLLKHWR